MTGMKQIHAQTVILDENSSAIQHLRSRDKRLAKLIKMVGPISYELHNEDPYSFFVHEIIEQMLSVKSARRIYGRLEELCNGNVCTEHICALSDEQIRSSGTSVAKVEYIRNVTEAFVSGYWNLEEMVAMSDHDVISLLTSVRGIGNWTAKMCLIFILNRPDVVPYEDGAFLQTYRWLYNTTDCSPQSVKKRCSKWSPYATAASRYFYRALDIGLTKDKFHLFKED